MRVLHIGRRRQHVQSQARGASRAIGACTEQTCEAQQGGDSTLMAAPALTAGRAEQDGQHCTCLPVIKAACQADSKRSSGAAYGARQRIHSRSGLPIAGGDAVAGSENQPSRHDTPTRTAPHSAHQAYRDRDRVLPSPRDASPVCKNSASGWEQESKGLVSSMRHSTRATQSDSAGVRSKRGSPLRGPRSPQGG